MAACFWSISVFICCLSLLGRGEVANLAHLQPKLKQTGNQTPFYNHLVAEVGTLAASAEFASREKLANQRNVSSDVTGAAVLQHWTENQKFIVGSTSRGTEEFLNGSIHDSGRLIVAKKAHGIMQEAFPAANAPSEESLRRLHSVPEGASKAVATSGRNLLEQWTAMRNHSGKALHAKNGTASVHTQLKGSGKLHKVNTTAGGNAVVSKQLAAQGHRSFGSNTSAPVFSKSFVHAHTLMHALGSDEPSKTDEQPELVASFHHEALVPSATSGSDLLDHWSSVHAKQVLSAEPVESSSEPVVENGKQAQTLPERTIMQDVANLKAEEPELENSKQMQALPEENIKEDLANLKAARKEALSGNIKQDVANLKAARKESASRSSHLHELMHSLGDSTVEEDSQQEKAASPESAVEHGAKMGDDELRKWSLAHTTPFPVLLKRRQPSAIPSASTVLPVHESAHERIKTSSEPDKPKPTAKDLRRTLIHDAMRNVVIDAPDTSSLTKPSVSDSDEARTAGVNALERWSKSQDQARILKAMLPESRESRVSAAPAQYAERPSAQRHSGSDPFADVARATALDDAASRMQSAAQKWHASHFHDAMRAIGSDAPDLNAAPQSSPSVALRAAGTDTLENWVEAHKTKMFVMERVGRPQDTMNRGHVNDLDESKLVSQGEFNAAPDAQTAVTQKWHDYMHESHAHEAMRVIGNDAPDLDAATPQSSPSLGLRAAGTDALKQWAEAHKAHMVEMHPATNQDDTTGHGHDLEFDTVKPVSNAAQDTQTASAVDTGARHESARESDLHDAMRAIGEGARDTDRTASERVPSEGLRAAGTDALKQWTEAHAPKIRIVEMDPPAKPLDTQVFAIKVDGHAAASEEEREEKSRASQDLQSSLDRWHTSSIHSAMRDVGAGVSDLTKPESVVQHSSESLKTAGAEVLERWSNAHRPSKPRFMSAASGTDMTSSSRVPEPAVANDAEHKDVREITKHARLQAEKADGATPASSTKPLAQKPETIVQSSEAAPTVGGTAARQHLRQTAVVQNGEGLLDSWSKAHSEIERRRPQLVNMYPPTPAPESDIMAVALARERQKVAADENAANSNLALHRTLQNLVGGLGKFEEAPARVEQHTAEFDSATGADILATWAKSHPAQALRT